MRLKGFRVTNFRSVVDSGWVEVGNQTCLVGKNEAGKTAILHALAGLNPHSATSITFDKERDYPRRFYTEYARKHGKEEAEVVRSRWSLEDADIAEIARWFGPKALKIDGEDGTTIEIHRRYEDGEPRWDLKLDVPAALRHLMSVHGLSEEEIAPLAEAATDPPPLKWSALKYGFEPTRGRTDAEEDPQA